MNGGQINLRAFLITLGMCLFLLGLMLGYSALTAEPPRNDDMPVIFTVVGTGGLLTLLGIWWPSRR